MSNAERFNYGDAFNTSTANVPSVEIDPHGLDPHTKGAKVDAGKPRVGLVLGAFAKALLEVCKVGTFGAKKYTDDGWLEVANARARYTDAGLRHFLYEAAGEEVDSQSQLLHAAHEAWNSLAKLELLIREKENRCS